MSQRDLHLSIELAAAHVHEALCELRDTRGQRLPIPHRALINSAIRGLEAVQQRLFQLKEDPWQQQEPKPKQLHLL